MDSAKSGLLEMMGFKAQVIDLPQGADVSLAPIGAIVAAPPMRLEPGTMLMVLEPGIAEKIRSQVKAGKGGVIGVSGGVPIPVVSGDGQQPV
jgi:hypothetical protein